MLEIKNILDIFVLIVYDVRYKIDIMINKIYNDIKNHKFGASEDFASKNFF